jgi:cytochrome c
MKIGFALSIAASVIAAAGTPPARAEANAGRGKALFQTCAACHSLESSANKTGPSLKGLLGRPSASVEGFLYSPVMRRANVIWTPALLSEYLANPQGGVFKGNKMPFAGMAKADDRSDLIAYIQEASK